MVSRLFLLGVVLVLAGCESFESQKCGGLYVHTYYGGLAGGYRYVVVNDSPSLARELARICRGWPCHVNLIPWNDVPGAALEGAAFGAPQADDLKEFRAILERGGVSVTQRVQRGAEVAAACGQLRAARQSEAASQPLVLVPSRAALASGNS